MIKEAIQYFVELGNTRMEKVGDQVYSTQPIHRVKEPTPGAINVRSLSGLVEYIQSKFDGDENIMIHVCSPTKVEAFTTFNRDYDRKEMIKADAMLPEFIFDRFYDTETFNIKLQSCFIKDDERDIVLKVVGNIQEEDVNTYGDDGVTQTVTARTGVATLSKVVVPNPVSLRPYRTFVEVQQPASNFVFRMKNGPVASLFEADGGAWKLEAMSNIKEYLQVALEKEIEEGRVTIIA